MSQGRKHERLRSALVISEVALACLLLVGAGLLLRSFLQVMDVDLGFQPSHAAAIRIDYDDKATPEKRAATFHNIVDRVRAIPGVQATGVADMLPLDRNRSWGLQAKGRIYKPGELSGILVSIVTPGYLDAIGMHLQGGRDFSWHDQPKSEKVVIINEAAARLHWQGSNPVGRAASVNGNDARVIGVIADARESSMEESASPEMYLPISQESPEGPELVVRSRLDQGALQPSVMRVLRSVNPEQPLTEFRPLQELVDHAVSPRRFFVLLVMSFASLGLVLAALGIYGVISYSVTRQRQEIGIRMALGATQARVQMGVLGKTLRLTMVGIAAGIVASFGAARLIASLLFGTAPTDLFTFSATILTLALVAAAAGYIPARRASRTNPMEALRTS